DLAHVDELQAVTGVLVADRALDARAFPGALVREAAGDDGLLDLLDAAVAAQRQRAAANHLDAVVLLRVVGGGDDGAAVEVLRGVVGLEDAGIHGGGGAHVRILRPGPLPWAAEVVTASASGR